MDKRINIESRAVILGLTVYGLGMLALIIWSLSEDGVATFSQVFTKTIGAGLAGLSLTAAVYGAILRTRSRRRGPWN